MRPLVLPPDEGTQVRVGRREPARLSGELWGISAYFNPAGYSNKIDHLRCFASHIRAQGLKLLIVELEFDDGRFNVPDDAAEIVIRLRSTAILWQKERLLNIAVERLPDSCDRIVWLDTDILFENVCWVGETKELLEDYAVVQPYHEACWLSPGRFTRELRTDGSPHGTDLASDDRGGEFSEGTIRAPGAVCFMYANPNGDRVKGHPGFAWAMRRSTVAACGYYDRFILGGGDFVFASALFGFARSPFGQAALTEYCSPAQVLDISRWCNGFEDSVRGSVYFANGAVLHMWHGRSKDRRYEERYRILKEADFDPQNDIILDKNQCWRWNSAKLELHQRVREYFWDRKEEKPT